MAGPSANNPAPVVATAQSPTPPSGASSNPHTYPDDVIAAATTTSVANAGRQRHQPNKEPVKSPSTISLKGIACLNDSIHRSRKLPIADLNPHLMCVLCGGYFIDATTIVECLHSFCKTCIVKYLETSKYCPICDVQVHKTKPLHNIRPDKTLQDIVYKLVPGLYKAEMKRRRSHCESHQSAAGLLRDPLENRFVCMPDDDISLSLEYSTKCEVRQGPGNTQENIEARKEVIANRRFLRCSASVSISHLKKFVRVKYEIPQGYNVDIIYQDVSLPDDYTLLEVAYVFTWSKTEPMRFSYRIYEVSRPPPAKRLKPSCEPLVSSNCDAAAPILQLPTCTEDMEAVPKTTSNPVPDAGANVTSDTSETVASAALEQEEAVTTTSTSTVTIPSTTSTSDMEKISSDDISTKCADSPTNQPNTSVELTKAVVVEDGDKVVLVSAVEDDVTLPEPSPSSQNLEVVSESKVAPPEEDVPLVVDEPPAVVVPPVTELPKTLPVSLAVPPTLSCQPRKEHEKEAKSKDDKDKEKDKKRKEREKDKEKKQESENPPSKRHKCSPQEVTSTCGSGNTAKVVDTATSSSASSTVAPLSMVSTTTVTLCSARSSKSSSSKVKTPDVITIEPVEAQPNRDNKAKSTKPNSPSCSSSLKVTHTATTTSTTLSVTNGEAAIPPKTIACFSRKSEKEKHGKQKRDSELEEPNRLILASVPVSSPSPSASPGLSPSHSHHHKSHKSSSRTSEKSYRVVESSRSHHLAAASSLSPKSVAQLSPSGHPRIPPLSITAVASRTMHTCKTTCPPTSSSPPSSNRPNSTASTSSSSSPSSSPSSSSSSSSSSPSSSSSSSPSPATRVGTVTTPTVPTTVTSSVHSGDRPKHDQCGALDLSRSSTTSRHFGQSAKPRSKAPLPPPPSSRIMQRPMTVKSTAGTTVVISRAPPASIPVPNGAGLHVDQVCEKLAAKHGRGSNNNNNSLVVPSLSSGSRCSPNAFAVEAADAAAVVLLKRPEITLKRLDVPLHHHQRKVSIASPIIPPLHRGGGVLSRTSIGHHQHGVLQHHAALAAPTCRKPEITLMPVKTSLGCAISRPGSVHNGGPGHHGSNTVAATSTAFSSSPSSGKGSDKARA